jgi:hypothetical protein
MQEKDPETQHEPSFFSHAKTQSSQRVLFYLAFINSLRGLRALRENK